MRSRPTGPSSASVRRRRSRRPSHLHHRSTTCVSRKSPAQTSGPVRRDSAPPQGLDAALGSRKPRKTRALLATCLAPSGNGRLPGWGGRIRTYDTRYQKPMPYHLATPQQAPVSYCPSLRLARRNGRKSGGRSGRSDASGAGGFTCELRESPVRAPRQAGRADAPFAALGPERARRSPSRRQPIATALTSSSIASAYCSKFFANMPTSFFACAS